MMVSNARCQSRSGSSEQSRKNKGMPSLLLNMPRRSWLRQGRLEIDQGWLLLTHGVGAMRKYAIGAVLLDKDDPSQVIGRTREPILAAANEDREGYVPNVVYSCGALRHGDRIFIPYGVADSSVAFAFVTIEALLAAM